MFGQPRHLRAEPLDLPPQGDALRGLLLDSLPQGFDLLGVPLLFRFELRGQPPKGV